MEAVSESFRFYLKDRLEEIQNQNPQYSLRSFALSLGVSPGSLSHLLSGKRPFTQKMIVRICRSLKLPEEQIDEIFNEHKKYLKQKQLEHSVFDYFSNITYDIFLELAQLHEFELDMPWISRRLGVSLEKASGIIQNLQAIGLIQIEGNRVVVCDPNTIVLADTKTSAALKKLQLQSNMISRQSLESDPLTKRYHGTNTVAIDPNKMEEAKEYIREFRKKFCTQINKRNYGSQIYQLNVSFYRLDFNGDGSRS